MIGPGQFMNCPYETMSMSFGIWRSARLRTDSDSPPKIRESSIVRFLAVPIRCDITTGGKVSPFENHDPSLISFPTTGRCQLMLLNQQMLQPTDVGILGTKLGHPLPVFYLGNRLLGLIQSTSQSLGSLAVGLSGFQQLLDVSCGAALEHIYGEPRRFGIA